MQCPDSLEALCLNCPLLLEQFLLLSEEILQLLLFSFGPLQLRLPFSQHSTGLFLVFFSQVMPKGREIRIAQLSPISPLMAQYSGILPGLQVVPF